jgi:salicylate hydroxylase
MRPSLRVAVCGCGPAGLAAALFLKRSGHQVLMFERFESPQPVGSGLLLQPTGLGVLAELGLIDTVLALGHPIDRILGRVSLSNRVVLDVRYDSLGAGWRALAVHRAALFATLHDAVRAAGIDVVHSADLVRAECTARDAILITADGRQHGRFDLIVDAAGAHSPLAAGIARRKALPYGALWVNVPAPTQWTGPANCLEQRYRQASMMAGVLPVGSRTLGDPPLCAFFWSLRRDQLGAWRDAGVDAWKQQIAGLWPEAAALLDSVTDVSQVTFAQYDHFTAAQPCGVRIAHIGDSARSTSPQLGQGANMALLDALALSRSIDAHQTLDEAFRSYTRMRYWHIRGFQWASALFTPFYQSDGRVLPFVRDWLAAPASRLPVGRQVVARLVSGMTVPPLRGSQFHAWRRSRGTPGES